MATVKTEAQRRGARNRRAGHAYEREIANKLKDIFPDVRRHLEPRGCDSVGGIDLDNTGVYGIQMKNYANYAPINKIEEVKQGIPVLITKGQRKKSVVCMYFDDWKRLVKESLT